MLHGGAIAQILYFVARRPRNELLLCAVTVHRFPILLLTTRLTSWTFTNLPLVVELSRSSLVTAPGEPNMLLTKFRLTWAASQRAGRAQRVVKPSVVPRATPSTSRRLQRPCRAIVSQLWYLYADGQLGTMVSSRASWCKQRKDALATSRGGRARPAFRGRCCLLHAVAARVSSALLLSNCIRRSPLGDKLLARSCELATCILESPVVSSRVLTFDLTLLLHVQATDMETSFSSLLDDETELEEDEVVSDQEKEIDESLLVRFAVG